LKIFSLLSKSEKKETKNFLLQKTNDERDERHFFIIKNK
tara:strand:+ start:133 stop:249 length:117 start_codon:yes stop_codon:yes gene_type:complete